MQAIRHEAQPKVAVLTEAPLFADEEAARAAPAALLVRQDTAAKHSVAQPTQQQSPAGAGKEATGSIQQRLETKADTLADKKDGAKMLQASSKLAQAPLDSSRVTAAASSQKQQFQAAASPPHRPTSAAVGSPHSSDSAGVGNGAMQQAPSSPAKAAFHSSRVTAMAATSEQQSQPAASAPARAESGASFQLQKQQLRPAASPPHRSPPAARSPLQKQRPRAAAASSPKKSAPVAGELSPLGDSAAVMSGPASAHVSQREAAAKPSAHGSNQGRAESQTGPPGGQPSPVHQANSLLSSRRGTVMSASPKQRLPPASAPLAGSELHKDAAVRGSSVSVHASQQGGGAEHPAGVSQQGLTGVLRSPLGRQYAAAVQQAASPLRSQIEVQRLAGSVAPPKAGGQGTPQAGSQGAREAAAQLQSSPAVLQLGSSPQSRPSSSARCTTELRVRFREPAAEDRQAAARQHCAVEGMLARDEAQYAAALQQVPYASVLTKARHSSTDDPFSLHEGVDAAVRQAAKEHVRTDLELISYSDEVRQLMRCHITLLTCSLMHFQSIKEQCPSMFRTLLMRQL